MTEKENNPSTVASSAWLALAIVSSLALVTMYGETMVLPAIPNFIKDFGVSYNTASWILSSYLIAGAVMTPIAGKLSDIYGKKKVLLNLGDVSYVDSSGIGELVSSYTTTRNQGGQLKLLNLTKKVHDLLQITKLYTVFDVKDDEAGEVKSFS